MEFFPMLSLKKKNPRICVRSESSESVTRHKTSLCHFKGKHHSKNYFGLSKILGRIQPSKQWI